MENKKPLLLDLLHVICEMCPPPENSRRGVTVSCSTPGHDSHSVSLCGFVLLVEAEGTFGSAEQRVVRIVNHDLKDPFLTADTLRASVSNEVVSHDKAHRELGYSVRPLRESLTDAIAWYRERGWLGA